MLADALNGMAEQLAARDAELRHSKLILGEKTAFLEGTLEHMDQGLIMFDDAATVQVCNRRAMELLELPAALMLSRPNFQDVTRYQFERNEFGSARRSSRIGSRTSASSRSTMFMSGSARTAESLRSAPRRCLAGAPFGRTPT
jgi:nitrogen fixation/metabolism regulation signal transduction histidine kinase